MRMTKEQRKARKKQKDEEWQEELRRLRMKQFGNERKEIDDRISKQNFEILKSIHAKMLGTEFRAWYEATTGEEVGEFIRRVVIPPEEFIERFPDAGFSQMEWTQRIVEGIVNSNPWTDPEQRALWAEEVVRTDDPRKRRTILLRLATPRWANREKVLEVYQERERLSVETGIPHDVDHIVPIVNRHVCGLHCEFNLRVIPAFENRTKSNRYEI